MTSLFSWLITMVAGIFWLSRAFITLMSEMGKEMMIKPLDTNIEIILLFVTLVALILIVKRNMLGAFVYMVSYWWYFGADVYQTVIRIQSEGANIAPTDITVFLMSFIAIVISALTFFDILLNKNRKRQC